MGLFSCLCGSSKDEKPQKDDHGFSTDSEDTKANAPVEEPASVTDAPNSQADNVVVKSPQPTQEDNTQKAQDIIEEDISDQEPLSRLASTRPTDSPEELLREPEEKFGKQHLITDESIDKQATGAYRTATNDPNATEEDRWFEAKEAYAPH